MTDLGTVRYDPGVDAKLPWIRATKRGDFLSKHATKDEAVAANKAARLGRRPHMAASAAQPKARRAAPVAPAVVPRARKKPPALTTTMPPPKTRVSDAPPTPRKR